ncbi:MAG: hypothetical protein ABMA64_06720 [Myxococcota bacterium]
MFRRDIHGEAQRLGVAGLWGSANTLIERDLPPEEQSLYSMWDGRALKGPERPDGGLESFPALVSRVSMAEFLDRYGDRASCEVWVGDEVVGEGCEAACAAASQACRPWPEAECLSMCAGWPTAITECVTTAADCVAQVKCGWSVWERDHR